MYIYFN